MILYIILTIQHFGEQQLQVCLLLYLQELLIFVNFLSSYFFSFYLVRKRDKKLFEVARLRNIGLLGTGYA